MAADGCRISASGRTYCVEQTECIAFCHAVPLEMIPMDICPGCISMILGYPIWHGWVILVMIMNLIWLIYVMMILLPELKRHLMLMFKDHILFKWYLSVFCAQFGPDIDTDCPCSTKDRPTMPYSTPPGQEDLEYVSDELPDPKSLCKDHQGAKYLDRKHFCTIQIHPVYPVRVCWSSV